MYDDRITKTIERLSANENFNISGDREAIVELINSLEPKTLKVLNSFLIELNSRVKQCKSVKKVNFKVVASNDNTNILELTFTLNKKNNFNEVNSFMNKVYKSKRIIDKNNVLWFVKF